jgi:hypothetical protein
MEAEGRFVGRAACSILVAGLALLVTGCGASNEATVKGKVVANGQPVTGGSLTFSPMGSTGAEAAIGTVNADGTFSLSAHSAEGASLGKHRVLYTAPPPDVPADWTGQGLPPGVKPSPYANLVPKEGEVELKPGDNEVTVELVPSAARG